TCIFGSSSEVSWQSGVQYFLTGHDRQHLKPGHIPITYDNITHLVLSSNLVQIKKFFLNFPHSIMSFLNFFHCAQNL
ncbi:hypothetical protein Leryth_005669, partial [Lithospermum erythrorhizon]